jgi:4-hydroxy-2-oxoheptanedioate aldolase
MIRMNKLRQLVENGGIAFGATVQVPATALVEILGHVGFDFAMIDTEHGLFGIEAAGELIRAAQGVQLSPVVRVLKNDSALIMKALDLGAEGVIIPHISNQEQAQKAIQACRYGTAGSRGACPLVRAADYGLVDWQKYEEHANTDPLIFLLIEDLEGANQIEHILAVDGIDVIHLGAFDMSVSAGYRGNVDHPEIRKALDRILAACKERNVPVMHAMTNGADVDTWIGKGVRLFHQSADTIVFARACKAFLESVSHLRGRQLKPMDASP